MSYLDKWQGEGLEGPFVDLARQQLRLHFWTWYREHKNDVLFRVLFWTFRVRDLKWLFEQLFGSEV